MPTYEYSCKACGHALEAFQSMKAAPLVTCPQCGQESLKRLMGRGAGIIFKGSGFYETDYKREPSKQKEGAAASGESNSGASGTSSEGASNSSPVSPAKPAAAGGTSES